MKNFLDRLAGWWLDWRTDQAAKSNPVFDELQLKRATYENGRMDIVAIAPGILALADEAAGYLQACKAENFVEFDMMPRLDRGMRAVRVTIQWADRFSPAQRIAQVEQEAARLETALNWIIANAEISQPSPTQEISTWTFTTPRTQDNRIDDLMAAMEASND